MSEIERAVRSAGRRLLLIDVIRRLVLTVSAAIAALILARIIDRLFAMDLPWAPMAGGAAALALVGAMAWAVVSRISRLEAAVRLDEAAGLREAISTALTLERDKDPWSKAVLEHARARAARLNVRAHMPIARPPHASLPIYLLLGLIVVWFTVPEFDLAGRRAQQVAQQTKQAELVQVKADIKAQNKKLEELLAKAAVEVKNEAGDADSPGASDPAAPLPQDLQRVQVKKLTSLADQLEAMRDGEKARKFRAMNEALRRLRQPGAGPMDEFARNLAQGNFTQAKAELDELAKKFADAATTEGERQQAKQQAADLAKQLEKIAERTDSLSKQLEQAGFNADQAKKLASNPEALRQALQNMDALSMPQKEGLINLAEQMASTSSQMQNMSEALSKMGEQMSESGMSAEGMQAMQQLAGQLSDSEMAQMEMANLEAALAECKAQLAEMGQCLGNGEGQGGSGMGEGEGGGNGQQQAQGKGAGSGQGSSGNSPGQGNGLGPRPQEAQFALEKTKANVSTRQGPIIGSRLVFGEQIRGESRAEFSAAVATAAQNATEAMESLAVPRELHGSVKWYFGSLDTKGKTPDAAPASAPPATPATDATKK